MEFERKWLDAIAYSHCDREVSFGELFKKAAGLKEEIGRRFEASDLVAIQSQTCPQLLPFIVAIWMAGKVPALLHPRFPDKARTRNLETLALTGYVGGEELRDWVDRQSGASNFHFNLPDSKLASIVFTSGSSGEPKAVAHTFANHYWSALGAHENIAFGRGMSWAATLPMCHVGGLSLFFRSLIRGGKISFLDERLSFSAAIQDVNPTHLSLVPTQLEVLMETQVEVLRGLECLLIGGSPMSDVLFEKCVNLDIPIRLTYGMTESASQLATADVQEKHCGKVLKYRELKIENGEVLIGGKTLFSGYYTKGVFVERLGGWFTTGDLGEFDGKGNLLIKGRKDNMFISGGENIQPEEIEKIFLGAGLFGQCFVVPVKDEKYGFRPFVFVDKSIALEDLHAFSEDKLAKFMWPVGLARLPDKEGLKYSRESLEQLASILTG